MLTSSVWNLFFLKSVRAQFANSFLYSSSGILFIALNISLYSWSTWLLSINYEDKYVYIFSVYTLIGKISNVAQYSQEICLQRITMS